MDKSLAKDRKREVSALWREYGHGRLYWRRKWRGRDWENGAVALVKNGGARTWYFSIEALVEEIESGRGFNEEERWA